MTENSSLGRGFLRPCLQGAFNPSKETPYSMPLWPPKETPSISSWRRRKHVGGLRGRIRSGDAYGHHYPIPAWREYRESSASNLFKRLADDDNHGSELVSHAIGYIAASDMV